jgi:hypothetical protein
LIQSLFEDFEQQDLLKTDQEESNEPLYKEKSKMVFNKKSSAGFSFNLKMACQNGVRMLQKSLGEKK